MKMLLSLLLLTSLASAQAEVETREKVVSEKETKITVKLNHETVLCSRADYSASFLKILIPQLKDITLFDHRNFGAGAPCVAAGMCAPLGQMAPSDILDEEKPTEEVVVNVALTQIFQIDHDKKTCQVSLKENVTTNVRGLKFFHQRSKAIGQRLIDDCL